MLKKYLENLDKEKKIFMILGMMANKEHKEFIQILKDRVHSIIALDIPNQINFIKKENYQKLLNLVVFTQKQKTLLRKLLRILLWKTKMPLFSALEVYILLQRY